eukprot:4684158-Pyramimonas_sp.AAC.1
MYGALGVGFSQSEWYSIMLTVKKLGEDPVKELKTVRVTTSLEPREGRLHALRTALMTRKNPPWQRLVRFFGKVYGVKNDYYVFETTLQNEPEAPEDAPEPDPNVMPPEDFGTGANTYTYFVCHKLGGPISQLPPVTPEQINCAKKLKKFL